MKTFISFIVVIAICGGAFLALHGEEKEVCIEDWYAQTSQLFQSASRFFDHVGSPSSEEIKEIDAKLQALLPPETIDLSYSSDQAPITTALSLESQQQPLLPNLFHQDNAPGTKIKGQVHTDDQDNIVGAEVNVSIPTDIR